MAELHRQDLKVEERNRARCRGYGTRYVERVLLSEVFDRDHGLCWLCGGPTLLLPPTGAVVFAQTGRAQALVHPARATMDHVVRLVDGGDHSYANVRLAHYLCNARIERPPVEFLRRLLEGVQARWEANAATTARLAATGFAAASLRDRAGCASRRIHLVTRTDTGWLLACPPQQSYPVERMQQTADPPSCRPCRTAFRGS